MSRDIDAGELIVFSKPFAFVVESEYLERYCNICGKSVSTPWKCKGCEYFYTCDEESCDRFHSDVECFYLRNLKNTHGTTKLHAILMINRETISK